MLTTPQIVADFPGIYTHNMEIGNGKGIIFGIGFVFLFCHPCFVLPVICIFMFACSVCLPH